MDGGRLGPLITGQTAACLLAGCAVVTHPNGFQVGVELEPRAPGWTDELRMSADGAPGQFVWREGRFSVEIVDFVRSDPTYFMAFVRNEGEDDAFIRVRRSAPADPDPGLGAYQVFRARKFLRRGERVDESGWIELPAAGTIHVWIDGLPWLGEPAIGDTVSCAIDFESSAGTTKCPVEFGVARVFRKR